jgi:hypothetical protein
MEVPACAGAEPIADNDGVESRCIVDDEPLARSRCAPCWRLQLRRRARWWPRPPTAPRPCSTCGAQAFDLSAAGYAHARRRRHGPGARAAQLPDAPAVVFVTALCGARGHRLRAGGGRLPDQAGAAERLQAGAGKVERQGSARAGRPGGRARNRAGHPGPGPHRARARHRGALFQGRTTSTSPCAPPPAATSWTARCQRPRGAPGRASFLRVHRNALVARRRCGRSKSTSTRRGRGLGGAPERRSRTLAVSRRQLSAVRELLKEAR